MQSKNVYILTSSLLLLACLFLSAETSPGVLAADELKHVVPATYFFRGQSAAVQLRNAAGFRIADGKFVLVGLVDTSGYSSDVAEKYQGFLITEIKLSIEGSDLPPGQYGFGFSKQDKFTVMDVGNNDLLSVSAHVDQNLQRAVPLKIVADQDAYRFYAGKKWVSLKAR